MSADNTVSDVCSIITDGTHQPPKFKNKGIPFLFVSNIANNKLTYDTEKFIDQGTYNAQLSLSALGATFPRGQLRLRSLADGGGVPSGEAGGAAV